MSEAPWAKIWWDWYASRSHICLSGVALALGSPLMLICRAAADRNGDGHCDGEGDSEDGVTTDLVWVRDKAGKPITAAALAGIVRFPVEDVQRALAELVDAETLELSDDGVYGIPNFWRYQESAAAARTRKYRARAKRHGDGHGDAKRDGSGDDKRTEDRGQSVNTQRGGTTPPADASPRASKRDVAKVALSAAVKRLAPEYGHDVPPTASRAHASAGAAKVAGLVAKGAELAEAAERVARSALERLRSGKSTTFGYALNDCVIGPAAFAAPAARPGRLAPAPATTGKDFEND